MTAPTSAARATATPRPYTFARFASFPRLRHGITRRAPGLNRDGDLSFTSGGDPATVAASWRAWANAVGVAADAIVSARLVHGADVHHAGAADRGRWATGQPRPVADALLTDRPGTPLLLTVADCAPLLFHDPARGVVGLAHAGWRGTVADIAGATVRAMTARYGSDPRDILAGIGPAIGACCYVVGPEVVAAWRALGVADDTVARFVGLDGEREQWRFDLPRANRLLLERAGLPAANIEDAARCTACHLDEYFSHRAERGRAGRFAAIIALAEGRMSERPVPS